MTVGHSASRAKQTPPRSFGTITASGVRLRMTRRGWVIFLEKNVKFYTFDLQLLYNMV